MSKSPKLFFGGNKLRYAWCMKLKPDKAQEYKRRHDEIWPEMRAFLLEAGYRDYAIFQHEDKVFGTFATADLGRLLETLKSSPVAARWRTAMAELVDNAPDPRTGHQPLLEPIFYLE
jgi:L-rhamnose mutarotase